MDDLYQSRVNGMMFSRGVTNSIDLRIGNWIQPRSSVELTSDKLEGLRPWHFMIHAPVDDHALSNPFPYPSSEPSPLGLKPPHVLQQTRRQLYVVQSTTTTGVHSDARPIVVFCVSVRFGPASAPPSSLLFPAFEYGFASTSRTSCKCRSVGIQEAKVHELIVRCRQSCYRLDTQAKPSMSYRASDPLSPQSPGRG